MSPASRIRVEAGASGGYDVLVAPGLLDEVGGLVAERTPAKRCALVSDDNVAALFADRVAVSLRTVGIEPETWTVRPGEASKDWAEAGRLLEGFAEAGLGRDSLVVAVGGGVVGDLAGFCAATYLRGVPVVHVPTTLLAQTDSSIGGKTGVDLPHGKNLVGAFWQPLLVVSDTACLASLPDTEWRSGLAEVAKSAVLASEEALAGLEADASALAARQPDAIDRAVRMAAGFKARVVAGDEREAGERESLNYGHTFGHALEFATGYGRIPHGMAVGEGMRFAARMAQDVVGAPAAWTSRQADLLDALGLTALGGACDAETILLAMRLDKKVRDARIRFVLTKGPGDWLVDAVDENVIAAALEQWCGGSEGGGNT
jgi:3-dehydroquinate synthase